MGMMAYPQWDGFHGGQWQRTVDVRSFIQKNVTPYDGDEGFLSGPTQRTRKVWAKCEELLLRVVLAPDFISLKQQKRFVQNHG